MLRLCKQRGFFLCVWKPTAFQVNQLQFIFAPHVLKVNLTPDRRLFRGRLFMKGAYSTEQEDEISESNIWLPPIAKRRPRVNCRKTNPHQKAPLQIIDFP